MLIVSLSPYQRAHPGVSLAAPWLLPGCFLAFLIVPLPPRLLPGCSWLSGYVCSWLLLAAPGCSLGMPLCSGGPVAKRSSANVCAGTRATCVRGSGRAERPAGMRGRKARSAEAVPSRIGPPPKRSSTDALRPIRRSSVAAVLCRSGHLPKRRLAEARSRPTGLGRRPNDGNSFACVFANFRVEAERQPAVETKNATASLVAPCNAPTDTNSNQALHT